MNNADRCVCCGAVVPEGRMVCPNCEAELWPKWKSRPQAAERENAYEPIDRCIDLLGDHGHSGRAGDAH